MSSLLAVVVVAMLWFAALGVTLAGRHALRRHDPSMGRRMSRGHSRILG